jgi:hypothetical protein
MPRATAGEPVVATLLTPPGPPVGLGARIEVPITRAIASYWRPGELTGDTWTVELDPVVDGGEYLLVWRTPDGDPPAYEAFVPLFVGAAPA